MAMQTQASRLLRLSLLAAALLPGAQSSTFLSKEESQPTMDILSILEAELGSGHGRADEVRVAKLQEELSHTFATLPRNHLGNLESAGARYALHRLFVQRHAWQLNGLNPTGGDWSNNTAADALGDTVPESIRQLFKDRLGEHGVSLHELAVLAALLESMVHVEVDSRLSVALKALNVDGAGSISKAKANQVMQVYMASFVLGAPLATLTPQLARRHYDSVEQVYPTWSDTTKFLDGVRESTAPGATTFNFRLLSEVLSAAGEQYGRWQSGECTDLKNTLVRMESRPNSGRVLLSDFYGSALSGQHWQFTESVEYLRQLGALDDSSPREPSVIIPNYIGSASNCVASTGYYSVCCIDECEEIMDHVERAVGASTASAETLEKALISNGTSLSEGLRRRLQEVATHHGGAVPLHGRLFAQWLHHAFPRECPFPHVTGTTNPLQVEQFLAISGANVTATEEEMVQFVENGRARRSISEEPGEGLCSNMWSLEEELVDSKAHETQQKAILAPMSYLRAPVMCLAAASATVAILKTVANAMEGGAEAVKAQGPWLGTGKPTTYSV